MIHLAYNPNDMRRIFCWGDNIRANTFAEKKAKEYKERIYNTIKKIEHYSKYCGYDDRTTIHDKELNELLKILEGEENEKDKNY